MLYNKIIKAQTLRVFRENGVEISDADYREYMGKQLQKGRRLWNTEVKEVVGEEIFSKHRGESVPRVLAFGHAAGYLMSRIACVDREDSRESVVLASIFNLLISLFDRVCDERPDLYPLLVRGAPRRALGAALERGDGSNFPMNSDSTHLTLVSRLLEAYFKGLRELSALSGSGGVLKELKETILLMYDSEVSTRRLKFGCGRKADDVYDTLRNARSLPGWCICLTAFLSPSARKMRGIKKLKEGVLKIGDISWMIDDIVDTVEDLEARRWSYTWLKLNNRIGFVDERGNLPIDDEFLSEMINSGVISEAAESVCSNYLEAKDKYQKFFEREEDFEIPMLSWIKSWVNAL